MNKEDWKIFKRRNIKIIFLILDNNRILKKRYFKKFDKLLKFKFIQKKLYKILILFELLRVKITNKVSIPTMDFNITTRCTLRCQDCGSLMTFYTPQTHYDIDFEQFKIDLDKLLLNVNKIFEFKLIGGEPLLHKDLDKMIEYASTKEQIIGIEIVTNGTLLPSEKVVNALKNSKKAFLYVSNYMCSPNIKNYKYQQVINFLEDNCLNYITSEADDFKWVKRGEIYKGNRSKDEIKLEFSNCWQKNCCSYFNGEYFPCTRAFAIKHLKGYEDYNNEYINVRKAENKIHKDFVEFYSKDLYSVCDYCHFELNNQITPAIQSDQYETIS